MKIVATIEARMTSSRLPGKVLMNVNKKPILSFLINRLRQVSSIDEIVLATTINSTDDELITFANLNELSFFRGSENNVMKRVIDAADEAKADIIVEITGDCPLIDPQIIEQMIQIYTNNSAEYVNNCHIRSYPDGMDIQVFSLNTLKKSYQMTSNQLDYEHVTLHIRNNPQIFSHINIIAPQALYWPELGITLDEMEDFELISKIIKHFGPENTSFTCLDIINLLKQKKHWIKINENIERKGNT